VHQDDRRRIVGSGKGHMHAQPTGIQILMSHARQFWGSSHVK
jgi:hypothetical protein